MERTYYLASGLWTDEQKRLLDKYESLSNTHKVELFSPRKRQKVNNYDLKLDDPMRDVFIQEIFEQNISDLKYTDHLLANLSQPLDIGTLWEVGFFLSYKGPYHDLTRCVTVVDGNEEIISNWIKFTVDELEEYYQLDPDDDESEELLYITDFESFKDALKIGLTNRYSKFAVCIDDRDKDCMIALGFLYQIFGSNKVATYSTQNHGSNVMIAASISNHYRFKPELKDWNHSISKYKLNKETK